MANKMITDFTAVTTLANSDVFPLETIVSSAPVTRKITWQNIKGLLTLASWPVGSIYTSVSSTNPTSFFGGTWVSYAAGQVLVGLDAGQTEFDTVEETGGEKTHVLTVAELASHTHTQNSHNHTQNAHNHGLNGGYTDATTGAVGVDIATTATVNMAAGALDAATATNIATTATNNNAGSDTAHNNLQPYIVVYMWKRTA